MKLGGGGGDGTDCPVRNWCPRVSKHIGVKCGEAIARYSTDEGKSTADIERRIPDEQSVYCGIHVWIPGAGGAGCCIECGEAIARYSTDGGKSTADIHVSAGDGDGISGGSQVRIPGAGRAGCCIECSDAVTCGGSVYGCETTTRIDCSAGDGECRDGVVCVRIPSSDVYTRSGIDGCEAIACDGWGANGSEGTAQISRGAGYRYRVDGTVRVGIKCGDYACCGIKSRTVHANC